MLDKATRSEIGEAALGKTAHDETGEATSIKIRARTSMWWKRVGMAYREMTSFEVVADLKIAAMI